MGRGGSDWAGARGAQLVPAPVLAPRHRAAQRSRARAGWPGLGLWLGPAPARPYNHVYLPFVWRGWYDFGVGAIGDMGNYSFDTMFRVLKLASPVKVDASSTPRFPETYPVGSLIHWELPDAED